MVISINTSIDEGSLGVDFDNRKSINNRDKKGKNLLDNKNDYIAVDLETTGLDPLYDEIIEFAAIKVQDGEIVSKFQSFVKPSLNNFITELTGITNEMLKNAPELNAVLPQFLEFVEKETIVVHNANFDIDFIYDNCCSLDFEVFENDFIDTMRLSRRLFPNEQHNRLSDLIERFGISGEVKHRALSDALKAKECYKYMKQHAKNNGIDFKSLYPKQSLRAADITSTNTDFDELTPIFGKVFVFTGALQLMIRKNAMQLVADMGGVCGDRVTTKTNYLVLGNNDYCKSIKDGKSSKQKKAEKYKLDGFDIDIISENIFYDMISE